MNGEESGQQGWKRDQGRGPSRKRRGKQRFQHRTDATQARVERGNRERVFQDIEGLLRQIREQAEDSARWTEAQIQEFVVGVTAFTRALEQQEGDSIPPRLQSDYQRLRERLTQALRS